MVCLRGLRCFAAVVQLDDSNYIICHDNVQRITYMFIPLHETAMQHWILFPLASIPS